MPILSDAAARGLGLALPGARRAAHAGWLGFTADEWLRLAGFYGFVLALHALGWGLFCYYSWRHPSLVGLGLAAYLFGLRHAFDADHIAAVDDTVRWLMQKGRRPLGVGFFFSLGHSAVVFALTLATLFAAALMRQRLPALQGQGGVIGAAVSGSFLWLIGALNLLVLINIIRVWRGADSAGHTHEHMQALLSQRGFFNRIFNGMAGRWAQRVINHSWQMLPLGVLFGLGFDTASEIGLLATAAGASASGIPVLAVLSLPLLFAAGMSVMDTTDGVLMVKVYNWAFVNPPRKLFYNVVITTLSVAVALLIGSIELLQVLSGSLHLQGQFFRRVNALDFGTLGYLVVALFLLAWVVSVALWKFGGMEQRFSRAHSHAHEHSHADGLTHVHRHFHEP